MSGRESPKGAGQETEVTVESELHTSAGTKNSDGVGPTLQWQWLGRICVAHGVAVAGRWDRHMQASGRERERWAAMRKRADRLS